MRSAPTTGGTTARWLLPICAALFLAAWAGWGCRDVEVTAVPVASIEVVPAEARLTVGERRRLEAIATGEGGSRLDGRSIEWEAQDPGVAAVDSAGIVEAVGPGTTVVEARSGSAAGEARIRVERPASDDDEDDDRDDEDDEDDDRDDEDDEDDEKGKKGKKKGKGGGGGS